MKTVGLTEDTIKERAAKTAEKKPAAKRDTKPASEKKLAGE